MDRLKQLQKFIGKEFIESPSPFMRWLRPVVIAAEKGELTFQYTIREEWLNPMGNLHGGVTAAIMDDILGATMFSLNKPHFFTTINNVVDYFATAKMDDVILAETRISKLGKQFVHAECHIWNADRTRLLAKGISNLYRIVPST